MDSSAIKNLWVIMPVYNEAEALPKVLDEWIAELEKYFNNRYTLCVLNDGSSDDTQKIINQYAEKYPEIKPVDKENSGHGQSCIYGYRLALQEKADWVFQIDSDGQCIPSYLHELVKISEPNKVSYGYRKTREDGFQRIVVSRFVTLFVWSATGVWVRDANVPYRLMPANTLTTIVERIPQDFHLCNILVSIYQKKNFGINWINIHFRNRLGRTVNVKTFSFVKHGLGLFKELIRLKRQGTFIPK